MSFESICLFFFFFVVANLNKFYGESYIKQTFETQRLAKVVILKKLIKVWAGPVL